MRGQKFIKYFKLNKLNHRSSVMSNALLLVMALIFFGVIVVKLATFDKDTLNLFVGESVVRLQHDFYREIKKNIDDRVHLNRIIIQAYNQLNNNSGSVLVQKPWLSQNLFLPNPKDNLMWILNSKQDNYDFNIMHVSGMDYILLYNKLSGVNEDRPQHYYSLFISTPYGIRKLLYPNQKFYIMCRHDTLLASIEKDYEYYYLFISNSSELNKYERESFVIQPNVINTVIYDDYKIDVFIRPYQDLDNIFEIVVGCYDNK